MCGSSGEVERLLGSGGDARHERQELGKEGGREDLKTSLLLPGWILQTSTFTRREMFNMDMGDTEKLLLNEEQMKQRRYRNKKLAAFMIIPFLLLAIYGVLAIGGAAEVTPQWTQNLFRTRGEHVERQTAREQYLVGVGKADVTG